MKRSPGIGLAVACVVFSATSTCAVADDVEATSNKAHVKEIIVVCKTHFDIGYTHRVDE